MSSYNLNKKAQVSDAFSWVVATLVIIFLIVSSIYISSLLGKSKAVEKEKIIISEEDVDWINEKNNYAYGINDFNKEQIESWIVESDLDDE